MAKLKPVTVPELASARERALDLAQAVTDIHRRAEQGYVDEVADPARAAKNFASASRALAELAGWLLMKATINEYKAELEIELHKRAEP